MPTERDLITTKIILRAMFPVMKILLEDDLKMGKRFESVNARVQFIAKYNGEDIGACLVFTDGKLEIEQGIQNNPDITFSFSTIEKMNAMLAGKPVIPKIKGWLFNIVLLVKVLSLLLGMKILMPDVRPKEPEKQKLKAKMTVYMMTTALSQYNKSGDPDMVKWTSSQPERIYQMSIEPEGIAAYIKIKAGKSKAGRGKYTRRRPFVHMKFNTVAGALAVFLKEVEFVEALAKGYVFIEGSPEYAANLNDFMQRIQALIT